MEYKNIAKATFLSRPNRFIAHVEHEGQLQICHVKNTGRCRELLIPGSTVYIQKASNPNRKTPYSLIAVEKQGRLFNIDSSAPNQVFAEWVRSQASPLGQPLFIKPETTYHSSRLDFYIETKQSNLFAEVKGVTLEENGVLLFPDAPTQRGIKHVEELCRAKQEGYQAVIAFILQVEGASYFTPNYRTHPEFGQALQIAASQGVNIFAIDCFVTPTSLTPKGLVPVHL